MFGSEKVLQKIIDEWKEYKKKDVQAKSNDMNIFHILKIENNEVLICRFIGNLLDPNGSHGLEEEPLKLFLETILDNSPGSLKNASISLEDTTDKNRRVDIVIHVAGLIVPIEVKIWARDQNNQLNDYYRYYFPDSNNQNNIYYLTPDGHAPSEKSCSQEIRPMVKCISFGDTIYSWIDKITNLKNIDLNTKSILDQFKDVISYMCKSYGDMNKVRELLFPNGKIDRCKALLDILDMKDEILNEFRATYLNTYIIFDKNNYFMDTVETDAVDSKYAIMCIKRKKNHEIIAWLCVDTNLYLRAKNTVKTDHITGWHCEDDYPWIYISPNGLGKKFDLKNPGSDLTCSEININNILDDIQ